MSSLANQQQNLSFPGLLQVPGGITSTLQQVQDGNGNVTGLSLSSAGASVTTSSTFQASKNGITLTGALPRLISDGFGDLPTVKDFGAVGDGTTDDTAAFTAAIAASPTGVAVPAGSYKITGTVTGIFYSFGVVTIVTGTVNYISNLASLGTSTGSTLVGTTNGNTGSITRTVAAKLNDTVSVKDFGAIGDGVADDTAAMQAAHNTGQLIYYPAGTYVFTTISFVQGGIIGAGNLTKLISTNANSANLITFTGTTSVNAALFKNFIIVAASTKSNGAALAILPASGELSYLMIDGLYTYNTPIGISLNQCNYGSVINCTIINYTLFGVYFQNHITYGAGDFLIADNFINTAIPTGNRIGIFQDSGGGLRIIGNKILGGAVGYALNYSGSTPSGPLVIVGNSFENFDAQAIYFSCISTGYFGGIVISGNELGQTPCGIQFDSPTSVTITQVIIDGNLIFLNGPSTTTYGIALNNVSDFNIGPNTIISASGTPTGIRAESNCTRGKIATQLYNGFAANATLTNFSTTVFSNKDVQSGVAGSVTTSTVYGSLYTGTLAITFPTTFTIAPVVTCAIGNTANGGVSALPINVTTTGFTLQVIGMTNGGVVTGTTWIANGII